MENASKALLMAAGVLMGVVILSLAAYLFVTFSSSADDVKSEIANNQLNKFNSQFLAYEQREDLTVYDILTAVNLAENNNKYYQLDETYEPSDLVEINTNAGTYGSSYSKHTARKVIYDDFQALKQACINKGFELYVTSGYRSTAWQKEIYNHMVETYSVERADETCSRPGHSEHTTGLGLDIALDQYKYEEVENHPQYQWFLSQLSNYGFILRYPKDKENLTGYSYEAWHIRYVGKELAQKIEKSGLTFDEYYARHF